MLATSFIGKMNKTTVDYVLVSTCPVMSTGHHVDENLMDKKKKRSVFLRNLKQEGLKIKTVQLQDSELLFDIITAPQKVLERSVKATYVKDVFEKREGN